MATQIDLSTWQRAEHFSFFKDLANPYFSVCVRIDAGELFTACKQSGQSFYLACLYALLRANNSYQPVCHRIDNNQVWLCDKIEINAVQLDEQNLFKISYLPYAEGFADFSEKGKIAFETAISQPLFSEEFNSIEGRLNCIHVSVLPWLDFTGFSHATPFGEQNGIPKFVFGKFDKQLGTMPLNIDVHHGLMDGFHVAQFVNVLQQEMTALAKSLS